MSVSPLLLWMGALAIAELIRERWIRETPLQHREKWTAFGVLTGLYLLLA